MQAKRNLAINGHRQFFVITRFGDGSIDQAGPFASGEEAVRAMVQMEKEEQEWSDAQAEAEAARGPEFPNGEFPPFNV